MVKLIIKATPEQQAWIAERGERRWAAVTRKWSNEVTVLVSLRTSYKSACEESRIYQTVTGGTTAIEAAIKGADFFDTYDFWVEPPIVEACEVELQPEKQPEGVNVTSIGGWGLKIEEWLIDRLQESHEDAVLMGVIAPKRIDVKSTLKSLEIEGFHVEVGRNIYISTYDGTVSSHETDVLILSNDDDVTRDFEPVYDWLTAEFKAALNALETDNSNTQGGLFKYPRRVKPGIVHTGSAEGWKKV